MNIQDWFTSNNTSSMMPAPGMWFSGTRNDGRQFNGTIEKAVYSSKGTMVVVKIKDTNTFKSVYLHDCRGYLLSDFAA